MPATDLWAQEASDTGTPYGAVERFGATDGRFSPAFRDERRDTIWGRVGTQARGRRTSGDIEDLDFTGTLELNFGDPEDDETLYAASLLRATADLDDSTATGGVGTALPDVNAGFVDDERLFVHYAYLGLGFAGGDADVRLGRQESDTRLGPTFDGAALTVFPERRWRVRAYGGIPYAPYGTYDERELVIGADVAFSPTRQWRFVLEGLFFRRAESEFGRGGDDVRLAARVDYRDGARSVRAAVYSLDDQLQKVTLSTVIAVEHLDLTIVGDYTGVFERYDEFGLEFAEFFAVVGAFEPYHHVRASVTARLDRWLGTDAGHFAATVSTAVRVLEDRDARGNYNHGFFHLSGGVDVSDLGSVEGLFASAHAHFYRAEGDVENVAVTGDFGWERRQVVRLAVGVGYDRYRFDRISVDEQEDVRSVFVDVRVTLFGTARLRLAYEFATTNTDEFHTARTSLSVPF